MTYNILQSENYQQLPDKAKVLLMYMYMNHPIDKNFIFSYGYAESLRCANNHTRFYEHMQRLINAGFIRVVKQGSRGVPTVYCFSDEWYKDKRIESDVDISII